MAVTFIVSPKVRRFEVSRTAFRPFFLPNTLSQPMHMAETIDSRHFHELGSRQIAEGSGALFECVRGGIVLCCWCWRGWITHDGGVVDERLIVWHHFYKSINDATLASSSSSPPLPLFAGGCSSLPLLLAGCLEVDSCLLRLLTS